MVQAPRLSFERGKASLLREVEAEGSQANANDVRHEVPSHFRCACVVGKGAYGMVCEAIDRKAERKGTGSH